MLDHVLLYSRLAGVLISAGRRPLVVICIEPFHVHRCHAGVHLVHLAWVTLPRLYQMVKHEHFCVVEECFKPFFNVHVYRQNIKVKLALTNVIVLIRLKQ